MLVNLQEARSKKDGILTPLGVADQFLKLLEQEDINHAVVITVNKDGELSTVWSKADAITVVGILELSKQDVLNEAIE